MSTPPLTAVFDNERLWVEEDKALNWKAVAVRKEPPGDWKTALIDKIPGLEKGDEVIIQYVWVNGHGMWARIGRENKTDIDVRCSALKVTHR
jgi:hypothetical protein